MNDCAKVLVVDDDQMVLDFTSYALTSLKYGGEIYTATDGATALNLLKQDEDIGVMIVDLRLGTTVTGAQVAREAMALRPGLHVMLTSGDPAALKVAGQEMPSDVDLLPKPYRRRDLAARLSRLP